MEIENSPNGSGPSWPWVPGCLAAGMDAPGIAALIVAADPDGREPHSVSECLRALKAGAGVNLADGKALVKVARNQARILARSEPAADSDSDGAEAIRQNRAKWMNRIRAVGGFKLWDTSTERVEYFVIPLGHTSFAQVLAYLREIPDDAAPGSLSPVVSATGEPEPGDRIAWIAVLTTGKPDAIPGEMRTIPRPVGQVLNESERYPLVFTSDDIAVKISPEQVDRNTWMTKAGGMAATGRRMEEISKEAFRRLAHAAPVISTEPRLDSRGHMMLLPRGVMPPGWRNLAPNSDRESARLKWKRAAAIVQSSPGGIAAHVFGAAVDSFYIGYNHRQSAAIDLNGPDRATGKTTLWQSVGAMIGNPDEVALSADVASPVSVTTYTGQVSYGFMGLDETQVYKGDPDERARLVFRVVQTGRRLRAMSDGQGSTLGKPFHGLLLLTGNLPFVSQETVDKVFKGLSRRYFRFQVGNNNPIWNNAVECDDVASLTRSAYGWLIPIVAESVTNDEYCDWHRDIWVSLREEYPVQSPEHDQIMRVLAGHLAGSRAIDRVFGTDLESAARVNVGVFASGAAHKTTDTATLFIRDVRDHIQTHSGMWLTPGEWITYQNRNAADIDDLRGTDKEPIGIRGEDYFFIPGEPSLRKLCGWFGIADTDDVVDSLDKAGLLKIATGERAKGKKTTETWMVNPDDSKKRKRAYGYHVLASPDHESESDESGSDGQGPEPTPNPGPAPVTDPFATAPIAAPAASPERTADYSRPSWMPEPIRKTVGADGKPQYGDLITTWNKLWETQQIKGKAQVHSKPYPPDTIPEPLQLIGKDLGTGIHEGTHNYRNPEIPAGTPVTVLDRNAAYLSAIGTAILPIAGLSPFDGEGDTALTGIYHVESWPEMTGNAAHPWGVLKSSLAGQELWVTRETLNLGREMATAGIVTEPRVLDSLLGHRLRPNKPGVTRIEWIYGQLRDARAAAVKANDDDAEGFIKGLYSVGISTMGESNSNNRIWRPELPPIIRSAAFANNYRLARKFTTAGLAIAAIKNVDEIHVAADPDGVFSATDAKGTPIVIRGRGLAEIKVKGGYTMGTDGRPEPDSEWSNDRA
jgi:hypothetical protein